MRLHGCCLTRTWNLEETGRDVKKHEQTVLFSFWERTVQATPILIEGAPEAKETKEAEANTGPVELEDSDDEMEAHCRHCHCISLP